MNSWTIYYNPKCSKSRAALKAMQDYGLQPVVIDYLVNPLSKKDLIELISCLDAAPSGLLRVKESVFKLVEEGLDQTDCAAVSQAIVEFPQLMERPIIRYKKHAVIARSPEKIMSFCESQLEQISS